MSIVILDDHTVDPPSVSTNKNVKFALMDKLRIRNLTTQSFLFDNQPDSKPTFNNILISQIFQKKILFNSLFCVDDLEQPQNKLSSKNRITFVVDNVWYNAVL